MQRKLFVLLAGLILLSLMVSPADMAGAQGPTTPSMPRYSQLPSNPPLEPEWVGGMRPPLVPAIPGVSPSSINVGSPGVSFRYMQTFGQTEVPYIADSDHLNFPWGVATDGNNVLVGEIWGHRVLKYTNSGAHVSTIGKAGTAYNNGDPWEVVDMAVDSSGQTWVVDNTGKVLIFNTSNNFVSEFKSGMFSHPAGIAFDGAGNVYVSDGAAFWNDDIGNHRVLVFNSAGTLLSTIGTTGIKGAGNNLFFGPQHIEVYGSELYVADGGNNRVQIFVISNPEVPVYFRTIGGSSGSGDYQFDHPAGVAVNGSYIYVADRNNNRVQVFTRTGQDYVMTIGTGWGTGNDQFKSPSDVAVDSAGNLYVADFVNCRVQQFNISFEYQRTYGVTSTPYLTADNQYNAPSGVAIASGGSMYITEEAGHRLIKLNANGNVAWTVGAAGVKGDWDNANDRLDNPADIALNAAGQIYVADRWHGRVQIYNSEGTYVSTLGGGTENYSFSCPTGLTIDKNGYIYVTDCWRHRVQIFDASHGYVATLGTPDVPGSGDAYFNNPQGVAVDSNGFIYVADSDNYRVQVFNASWVYVRTLGVTGVNGSDFAHFGYPTRLAVDSSNRLYVSDSWNNRVQVFDSSGAYLTTIGGAWGNRTGMLRGPQGLTIDQSGALYVADSQNHRIQKFALGTSGWQQSNINGFGERANSWISSLSPFKGALYATGYQPYVRRMTANGEWITVSEKGFGDATNWQIEALAEFNSYLYAATYTWVCDDLNCNTGHTNGTQIWSSSDGSTWNNVTPAGSIGSGNRHIADFAVFDGYLYASLDSSDPTNGAEIWRTANGLAWARVLENGFDNDVYNTVALSLVVYKGNLYAGTRHGDWYSDGHADGPLGGEVWSSNNGTTWIRVNDPGFGNLEAHRVEKLLVFKDGLYAYVSHVGGTVNGADVWRCIQTVCSTQSNWTKVMDNGFGNPQNQYLYTGASFNGYLYGAVANYATGFQLWRTSDGATWEKASSNDGLGDSNNQYVSNNAMTVFNNSLFIGTSNWVNGGEVWQMLRQVYLPQIMR